jgi:hypothetical protein
MAPTTQDLIRKLIPIIDAARLRNLSRRLDGSKLSTERGKPATLAEYFARRKS